MLIAMTVLAAIGLSIWGGGLPCVVKSLTGFPCPSCGITRALWAAARRKWAESFAWHPLWPGLVVVLAMYVLQWHSQRFLKLKVVLESKKFWAWSVGLLLTVYMFRMLRDFPTVAPMDFDREAVIPRIAMSLKRLFSALA